VLGCGARKKDIASQINMSKQTVKGSLYRYLLQDCRFKSVPACGFFK
jgi:hypothetical protein